VSAQDRKAPGELPAVWDSFKGLPESGRVAEGSGWGGVCVSRATAGLQEAGGSGYRNKDFKSKGPF
jgi:hypothetical protein